MGIVRNPANTMRRGRVGETSYYISGGQQIARQALNGSNFGESARRSEAQQRRRVLWANLVNFYKASRTWMPKAFETKRRNQSDYNKFMQLNINTTRVALTKAESEAGACVVSNFLVSQGSLPSIEISKVYNRWSTNLAVGNLAITESTTVAELSVALVGNNANVHEGMQLSFVSYQQSIDALGIPRTICRCYEVTIDTKNSTPLYASFPGFAASVLQGKLATSDNISIGGFAYIISELSTSGLAVSTQQLIVNNDDLLLRYTSSNQLSLAVDSYGVDREVILSPVGTVLQEPESQPAYIRYITIDNVKYTANDYLGTGASLSGKSMQVYLSRSIGEGFDDSIFLLTDDGQITFNIDYVGGNILGGAIGASTSQLRVRLLRIVSETGITVEIPFDVTQTGGDL